MTADDRGTRRRERLQQMVDELNERVAREHARSVRTRSPSAAAPVAGP